MVKFFLKISTMIGLLVVLVICCTGIAAGAAVSRTSEDEMKSVNATEGGDLSISIQISGADTDPQVLVTRLRNSSDELIAQLMCHSGDCESDTWLSGASLLYDGHNVTLVLMNVSQSQTGLYELKEMSSALTKSRIYSINVFKAPVGDFISAPRPSVASSEGLSSGRITAGVIFTLGLIAAVTAIAVAAIYHFWWKRAFDKVSQQDDFPASSQSGSLQVIVNS